MRLTSMAVICVASAQAVQFKFLWWGSEDSQETLAQAEATETSAEEQPLADLIFDALDEDGDGEVTQDEYEDYYQDAVEGANDIASAQAAEAFVARYDMDADDSVSRSEFTMDSMQRDWIVNDASSSDDSQQEEKPSAKTILDAAAGKMEKVRKDLMQQTHASHEAKPSVPSKTEE